MLRPELTALRPEPAAVLLGIKFIWRNAMRILGHIKDITSRGRA